MPPSESSARGQVHYATDGRDILHNDPDGWEVDQPWLWWDGPADGSGEGGPWGNPPPGAEYAVPGLRGTSLPAVTRCTQLIADNIAGMPWKVYRGREQLPTPGWILDPQVQRLDGRILAADVPLAVRYSNVEFWAQAITSFLWWGEAMIYTPRQRDDDTGLPTGPITPPLYLLHPEKVELDDDGTWYVETDTGDEYPLSPYELLVVRNYVRPGRLRGVGTIQSGAAEHVLSANLRGYMDTLLQRGVPNGYLKSSKPDLNAAAAKKLKDEWMRQHGGNRKSIAVLNATTEFVSLDLDPQVVQVVELEKLQAWKVCLEFGVPPAKLGIDMGQAMTYSNLEAQNTAFVQDSLLPVARKFEAAIDALLPAGQSLKIDFRMLMRGDTSSRYDAYKTGLDAGFLTEDEARDAEDLPPLPPADANDSLAPAGADDDDGDVVPLTGT